MKLKEIEPIINLLNPILSEKCGCVLSLEVIDVLDELEEQLEKIKKVRIKLIEDYAEKDEDGEYITIKNKEGFDIHTFGENLEKVEEELSNLMEQNFELTKWINIENLENNIKIEPINLKILIDRKVIRK